MTSLQNSSVDQQAYNAATSGASWSAKSEWRQHWPLVPSSILGYALGVTHVYMIGVFIAPLSEELGWTRAFISSGLTIVSAFSIVCAPLVGLLVDRVGPRRIGLCGLVAYCAAIGLLATVSASPWHWWGLWVLIAASVQLVKPTVWTAAVSSRFIASRGLAIGVTLSGGSLGAILTPIVGTYLVEAFDWRVAYLGIAGFWAMLAIPPCLLFFYGAQDRLRSRQEPKRKASSDRLAGAELAQALTSRRFVQLACAVVLVGIITMGIVVHFIPMLTANGLGRETAAAAAGLVGLTAFVGRIVTGLLLDRLHGALVGSAAFILTTLACGLLLTHDGSGPGAIVIALVVGFALGADMDVAAYLTGRYFGLRHFGTMFGMIVGLLSICSGGGPLIAGVVFDETSSYRLFLLIGIPVSLMASFLVGTLGRYPASPSIVIAKPATE